MRQVVATAGHVDHGKSTLVRALTGIEPDRLAEERRRGLTIDLGFAWTTLPSGQEVSFVDVPGHERFLGNMLAGLGPAPLVCFVVAADSGWSAQSGDHRDALAALGIDQGLLVVSRSDLAPDRVGSPRPAVSSAAPVSPTLPRSASPPSQVRGYRHCARPSTTSSRPPGTRPRASGCVSGSTAPSASPAPGPS